MSNTHETGTGNLNAPNDERGNANPDVNQPIERPFRDAGNLYEIPRTRPDDPPMRRWWTDDEPQSGSGPQQNG